MITDISDEGLREWELIMFGTIEMWCEEVRQHWEFKKTMDLAYSCGIILYKS